MKDSPVKILVTNDDGYHASGIVALRNHLTPLGNVVSLAPFTNKSGCGSALSIGIPLPRVVHVEGDNWCLDATPADCAYVGLHSDLFGQDVDILVSGINDGDNLSTDIHSSGTIAAAMQGIHLAIPPVAVSLCTKFDRSVKTKHFDTAGLAAYEFVKFLLKCNINWKRGTFFNINVPNIPSKELHEDKWTWTTSAWRGCPTKCAKIDERQYMIGDRGQLDQFESSMDALAIQSKRVSITPLCINMSVEEPRESLYYD